MDQLDHVRSSQKLISQSTQWNQSGRLVEAGDLTHPFIMTQTTEQVDRILVYQNNNA